MHTIESFDYAIVTTVLGVLVVFVALTLLSLMMVALKAVFGERSAERSGRPAGASGKGAAAGAGPGAPAAGPAGKGAGSGGPKAGEMPLPPSWLTAAVAAFLAAEEASGPTAEPWLPEFNHFDPWLGPARSMRRGK